MEHNIFSKDNRNNFIDKNRAFIYDTTCYFCNRDLDWQKDDELNIALIAFNRACESQEETKSSFFNYAYMLIRSALIQYYIKLEKSPLLVFEYGSKNYSDLLNSLSEFEIYFDNKARGLEIALFTDELKNYSIDYKNIVSLEFTDPALKNKILNLVINICKTENIKNELLVDKIYDVNKLSSLCDLDISLLKKYRKYIIMLLIIISSDDYLYLKSFLSIKVGDSHA